MGPQYVALMEDVVLEQCIYEDLSLTILQIALLKMKKKTK